MSPGIHVHNPRGQLPEDRSTHIPGVVLERGEKTVGVPVNDSKGVRLPGCERIGQRVELADRVIAVADRVRQAIPQHRAG